MKRKIENLKENQDMEYRQGRSIYMSLWKKNENESEVNEIEHTLSDKLKKTFLGKILESTYRKGI